jgi:2'-5' RNA ligase
VRTFIAIELPAPVKERLGALVDSLRNSGARITWVKPEAMHLTLRFLGDVDSEPLERLCEDLRTSLADASRFELAVHGLGAFPNLRRPSVLWSGIVPQGDELFRVQAATEQAARGIGLLPETKAFHPHVTLARIKDPTEAGKIMPQWNPERAFEGGTFAADGVMLFSSTLTPRGPEYRLVQEFSLR